MSLFGSLYTAVSGLSAQSQATAIISNNIANVNTTGFKRSEAAFAALVTVESHAAKYSPGAVKVHRLQQVDQQGQIQQTSSTTDASIAGDGFFVVRAENSLDLTGDFKFTRNGQFNEDDEGILQNSAGMYLYGWPVDPEYADRSLTVDDTVYNPDVSALVPVDVSLANGQSRQTTDGVLGLNLDADEISKSVDYFAVAPDEQVVPFPSEVDFSRTLRVYDSLGSAQDLTFQFVKILGPQASAILPVTELEAGDFLSDAPITAAVGNDFTVSINGAAPVTIPAGGVVADVTTVFDVINEINNIGGGGLAEAYLNADGQLVITALDPTHTLDVVDGTGLLADFGQSTPLNLTTTGTPPVDNTIVAPFDDSVFPQFGIDPYVTPTAGSYNARGWWQVNIVGPNGPIPINQGFINFNSDGSLNAQADLLGNKDIELRNLDWGNGSELQDIKIDIEGFTQFAGLYNVSYANQNGAELGLKTGIEIDREGYVNARFSNGTLSRLYKLPIATFTSPTNLQEISTTSYRESAESGSPLLQEAGVSQAGFLEINSIEQSNVDLADEFTKLIVTQRAYSANTKVITTVDDVRGLAETTIEYRN